MSIFRFGVCTCGRRSFHRKICKQLNECTERAAKRETGESFKRPPIGTSRCFLRISPSARTAVQCLLLPLRTHRRTHPGRALCTNRPNSYVTRAVRRVALTHTRSPAAARLVEGAISSRWDAINRKDNERTGLAGAAATRRFMYGN